MDSQLKAAFRSFENEVNTELVRLIEEGVPPYDAIDKARDIVSARRSHEARKALSDEK